MTEEKRLSMLKVPVGPVDMVLDTDAYNEIDDQFAIAYALAASETLRVNAFYAAPFLNENSTSPADGMEKSFREIQKLLALAGKDVPVFRGSTAYLADENTAQCSDAAEDLVRRAMEHSQGRPLYTVGIGAITNIASALLLKPEIAERMVVVWLGGHALHWPDNAEFNMKQDIAAARVVFGSGVPLVLLPCMGVVNVFATTGPELDFWLKGKNPLCDYLVQHTREAAERYARGRAWSRILWDVTAVGWLLNESGKLMKDRLVPTPVPEYDNRYSQDLRRPMCKMVYHIDRDALFNDLAEHLIALGGSVKRV